ncbi:cyclic nucleotide-binding domain protein (macronuclear) [Tetrahymena thermophila SB210]|uniref:Cyclic nucleotide-binding domain protein n=1 Tax=Tetrahymena thermophila (strain SB210) TaxID=312017 RepID=Q22EI7_TETTS|nr:cyclic nucleotide-binding domain protein [Tetrahymena thermophila SB210]EAR83665.2 cyclic nucleotide-binding domain protein [Tetrahymena thermophila SB210]|eukprot:XP_001031328.2 cyclic nucleotide-binding domain protein [Tetrahymena thermophila SB210]
MNSLITESNIDLTELQSQQNTEQDLSILQSQSKPPSTVFTNQPRKYHEKKHKKLKTEDDDEPSYISFYRYPIKSYDEQKKRKQLIILDSPLDKISPTINNKYNHKKKKFNNSLRRSFTPQRSDTPSKSIDQQDEQKNIFQRLQISKISKLFVLKIRQLSQKYNYRHLRKVQFDLIGDVATSKLYESQQDINIESFSYKRQIVRNFYKIVFFLNKKIPSNPESKLFFIWNIIFCLSTLIYLFYLPIYYSFNQEIVWFNQVIMIIFIIKIILSFIKGYYEKGELVQDTEKIVRKYIKLQFMIDFAIVICTLSNFLLIICYLRLPYVLKIIKQIFYQFQFMRKNEFVQQIFCLLLILFLQIQIGGSLFHYVGQSQISINPTNNWLQASDIINNEWYERYYISIYFAFTTLMNVIYGDIHAYNYAERFTVMMICLCSYISFGYFITVVGLLLQEYAASLEEFYQKRQKIMNYMIQRSISKKNQIKMMHYLEYLLRKSQKNDEGSVKLLEDAPLSLRRSLFQDFFGKILTSNKYIPNHLSHSFINELSQSMEEVIIQPGKQFVQEGEMQSKVYFLIKGQVDIFITSRKQECVLQKYTTKGVDICLKSAFTNQPISYSVKSSSEQLTLAYFEMEKFLELIKQYPEDYESFCQWRDELILKEHQLTFKCKSCKNIDHELDECPLINLRLPKQKIINQNFFEETQERFYIERKKRIFKARPQKGQVNLKLKQYRIFLTKAVIPQMSQDVENLLQMSDENFYKIMPPIKIVNCDENMMYEFSSDQVSKGIDGIQQDLIVETQIQKRVSLEKIDENSQSSSSSSETTSSSDESIDESLDDKPRNYTPQRSKQLIKDSHPERVKSSRLHQNKQNRIRERLGIQKNVGLLTKQKQHLINMNSLIEQKKKINNDPLKQNVPIQGLKKRTDKISSLYTKILFREQQKQKRLKYLQFLWAQKQNQKPSYLDRRNSQSQISTIKIDKYAYDIEFNQLKQRNINQNLFQFDFEKIETFKRYNPYYNYDKVIGRYNLIQKQINFFNNKKKSPQQKNYKKLHLFFEN